MAIVHDVPKCISTLLLILFVLICGEISIVEAQAGRLPQDEANALREIADQLGKKDWNFSLNPCDGNSSWITPKRDGMLNYNNTLICNCSFPTGECHVFHIYLIAQDLAGVLPPSLAKLHYLKTINLDRNYLSGTIPKEWASTKLEILSVTVNRLSGPIPDYLGHIATLKYLVLESNQFNGIVPAELGKLVNLESLILSANNLMGELPTELNDLTNLKEIRLSRNNFTGKMPSFQSWKRLEKLEIEASGFEGPISSGISVLNSLQELRIRDLNGGSSKFPPLENMPNLTRLMLSNCNISGSIPNYVANMRQLIVLDLSFNKLEGNISNLEGLKNVVVNYMYLTGNLLTGPIPEWMNNRDNQFIDLSYNNFTEKSVLLSCPGKALNLFRSFPRWINLEFDKCTPCLEDVYSLHINCGGEEATIGETTYEADVDTRVSVPKKENWGMSTTGHFWDINVTASDSVAENVSVLVGNDTRLLYTRARLSPLSLTYYGHCFADGNYTVSLHFAEIIIRENQSFQSLGRRIFDIYIQDELVRKDFDIVQEAQGVDKAVVLKFKSVVKEKTLEIRFHWAGKGTTIVPRRGIYGPLISAISVESNFKLPSDGKRKIFTVIIGSIASISFLIFMILGMFWWRGCPGSNISSERDLRGLDLQTGLFTFRQIKTATDNFDEANKIGEGGFGSVYKGILLDGTVIAVKQLSSESKQGNREFVNEIGMISGLQHPNLVRLYGCCVEENQLLLVYEYMENNSLARALFGPKELQLKLDWPTRQRICIGIAKGLMFLHEESTLKIVHRDIKTTNVLLDRDLNPKISDFGLAKLHDEENTHISTRVAGTAGYMAPEYAQWGYLTYKADVYSFGIVALEIVAGKNNIKYHPNENNVCLLDWALALQQKGCLLELVDPKLDSNFNEEEALRMIQGALLCTNPSPALRPTMSALVSMLEGRISVQNIITDPSIYSDELRFKALKDKYEARSSESKTFIDSSEATRYGSSTTSARDLYEINLDSQ